MQQNLICLHLNQDIFRKYFEMSKAELSRNGAYLFISDEKHCYPCRVSLQDAEVGETVLAVNFSHHPVTGPYQSSGPIFIRKEAETARLELNEIPSMLRHRLLSVRGYDSESLMVEGDTVAGEKLEPVLEKQFGNNAVEYVHIHNAGPGCFNCEIRRA